MRLILCLIQAYLIQFAKGLFLCLRVCISSPAVYYRAGAQLYDSVALNDAFASVSFQG